MPEESKTHDQREIEATRPKPQPAQQGLQGFESAVAVDPAVALQRATAGPPRALGPDDILALQRTVGNSAVQHLLNSRMVQAKLRINAPSDVYEQEADRVADAVTGSMKSPVQRQEVPEEELQMEAAESQPVNVSAQFETQIGAARGRGEPLPDTVREPMGQAFGADFSGVRVHTDSESDALNQQLRAKAFTTGQDIFLRRGEYSPASDEGRKLIAHELTHVVQQGADQMTGGSKGNIHKNGLIQRIAWDTPLYSQETKNRVAALSASLGGGNDAAAIFATLCNHSRAHFTYVPTAGGSIGDALGSRLLNCQTISELLILIWLHRNRNGNALPHGILGGNTPVLTPPVANPGIKIQNNIRDGNGRMLFNAGHTVAQIEGTHYDVITGLSGNLDALFTECPRVQGEGIVHSCVIPGDVRHEFTRIGLTGNGLSEFYAKPPVTV